MEQTMDRDHVEPSASVGEGPATSPPGCLIPPSPNGGTIVVFQPSVDIWEQRGTADWTLALGPIVMPGDNHRAMNTHVGMHTCIHP